MSKALEAACRFAIEHSKKQNRELITPDDLLLGSLRSIAQFGIAEIGLWNIDLEALGFDWLAIGKDKRHKVAYSAEIVAVLDLAAKISRASRSPVLRVQDLLVAFAGSEDGLMGSLKNQYGFTGAQWRAAVAASRLLPDESVSNESTSGIGTRPVEREYLTPEE